MNDYFKKLVVTRLKAIPPNVGFSIGSYGDYSRDQLIQEVEKGTKVGQAAVNQQLNFIREMPKLSKVLGEHYAQR